jgi:hypothetical protein
MIISRISKIHKFILTFKTKYFADTTVPLGRWGLDLSDKQILHRVERANEDHCGPCGLEYISKNKEK